VASPVCGFGIDRLGRNIFWLLIGVVVTTACHGLLAFTFLTPFVPMVGIGYIIPQCTCYCCCLVYLWLVVMLAAGADVWQPATSLNSSVVCS